MARCVSSAGHSRHVLSGLIEGEGNKSTLCKSFQASAPLATTHTSEPRVRVGEQHKFTGQTFANPKKSLFYPPTERGVSQFSKKHSEHVMFSPHSHGLCPVLFPTRISPGLTSHLLGGTLSCLSSKASHSFYLALIPPSDSSDWQLSKLLLHFSPSLSALSSAAHGQPMYFVLHHGI